MNQQLYTVLKQLYGRYTGQEIADVIAQIRKEISAEQEQAELKRQLKVIQGKIKVSDSDCLPNQ